MSQVHVAVGVIVQPGSCFFDRKILISKRPDHVHQGGLWEFPGGKVEAQEGVRDALARELHEELGVSINTSPEQLRPLIKIKHDYGDKQVVLDVFEVLGFSGEPHGREGQPVKWVGLESLSEHHFPAANQPIVRACSLSRRYVITPEYASLEHAQENIMHLISTGHEMFLLRQPQLEKSTYLSWYQVLLNECRESRVKLLASCPGDWLGGLDADGVHLSWRSAKLHQCRPVPNSMMLGVSCHNEEERQHAELMGADFITLSPVAKTASHPDVIPLGWDEFASQVDKAVIPVYALGGMQAQDEQKVFGLSAQGIAGIRLWQEHER